MPRPKAIATPNETTEVNRDARRRKPGPSILSPAKREESSETVMRWSARFT